MQEVERRFRWNDLRVIDVNNTATIIALEELMVPGDRDGAYQLLSKTNALLNMLDESVESPVESIFGYAFFAIQVITDRRDPWQPQARIGKYRADFLFGKKLIVEIDGHDFHEKTKTQAQRDKSRDRWLAHRYTVLRFTGSEVFHNPFACAHEATHFLGSKRELHSLESSILKLDELVRKSRGG